MQLAIDADYNLLHNEDDYEAVANKRLVAAVIASAFVDMRAGVRVTRDKQVAAQYRQERTQKRSAAIEWLLSEEFYPFSFLWCCSVLDMEPELLRRSATLLENEENPRRLKAHFKKSEHGTGK